MTTIFSRLYNRIIIWSEHPKAVYYLILMSFTEACIFPIPPDVMLISMSLAQPKKAWSYASITTVSSVLGGILGFFLGAFFFDILFPYIEYFGYIQHYQQVVQWYQHWGFWVVLIVGFSPIPYKIFTITSGALHMAFIPFLLASFISRGARFFLVSALLYFYGDHLRGFLNKFIEWIGWLLVLLVALVYAFYQFCYL